MRAMPVRKWVYSMAASASRTWVKKSRRMTAGTTVPTVVTLRSHSVITHSISSVWD
jgi:hypothetical protein